MLRCAQHDSAGTLLPGHRHGQPLLRADEVVVVVHARIQLHPVDLAVERAGVHCIVLRHRRRAFIPHLRRLITGKGHRLRRCDAAPAHFAAIHEQRDVVALCESTTFIGKLHAHLMLAGGQQGGSFSVETLQAQQVVGVLEPSLFGVQTPTAERTALRDNHAVRVAIGNHNLDSDGMSDSTLLFPPIESWNYLSFNVLACLHYAKRPFLVPTYPTSPKNSAFGRCVLSIKQVDCKQWCSILWLSLEMVSVTVVNKGDTPHWYCYLLFRTH